MSENLLKSSNMSEEFKITSDLKFPVQIEGDILFNDQMIKLVCRLLGIDSIEITTNNEKVQVSISGISGDGSALMGRSKELSESTSSLINIDQIFASFSSMKFHDSKILLNLELIRDELLTKGKSYNDLKDPKIWATELDRILKKELISLNLKKQRLNISERWEQFYLIIFALVMGSYLESALTSDDINRYVNLAGGTLRTYFLHIGFFKYISPRLLGRKTRNRLSLIFPYGVEFDRAIIATLIILLFPMVAAKEG